MATQIFAQNDAQLDHYLAAYKNIMSAVGFVNRYTGENIKLSAEQKIVWFYILDRYKFFKDKEQLYFDNQAEIALACGVSERTVLRCIKILSDSVDDNTGKHVGCGYVHIEQTRIGGHKSNSYIILADLGLVQPEKAPEESTKTQKTNTKAPAKQKAIEELIEPPCDDNNTPASQDWAFESIPYGDEPGWLDNTLQDDGSTADAFAYIEGASFKEITPKNNDQAKDNAIQGLEQVSDFSCNFTKELPQKRFNPNGSISSEMLSYCKALNIPIRTSVQGDQVYIVNGSQCSIGTDGFIPYVPSPAKSVADLDQSFLDSLPY
jgi:hypothetical protein